MTMLGLKFQVPFLMMHAEELTFRNVCFLFELNKEGEMQ